MRTLVVEDDVALRKLVERGLTEEGMSVDVAQDGEEGWFLARTEDYDVIVLDLMIPKLSGAQLLAKLRAAGRRVPVLVLTARDATAEKVALLDLGADDYLTKPFGFDELVARLRALIRRSHGAAASVIVVGDLEVDLAARRVVRGGRPIELRAKPFAVLELLALHAGKLVTRTAIYDHVYAYDRFTLSNVVDVHVHALREAIDRGFPTALVHTVRGQGYVLEVRP